LYVPVTKKLTFVTLLMIYENVVGLVLSPSMEHMWLHLSNFAVNYEKELGTFFRIRHIISPFCDILGNNVHCWNTRQWDQLFQSLPHLTHLTINDYKERSNDTKSTDTINHSFTTTTTTVKTIIPEEIKVVKNKKPSLIIELNNYYQYTELIATILKSERRNFIVNGNSLQPCVQCKRECYPMRRCGQGCVYDGTYNCWDCCSHTINKQIIGCDGCNQQFHPKCVQVLKKLVPQIEIMKKICRDCSDEEGIKDKIEIIFDNEGQVTQVKNILCTQCTVLVSCQVPTCTETMCLSRHHSYICHICTRTVCQFHVIRHLLSGHDTCHDCKRNHYHTQSKPLKQNPDST
jgi:hypothetical protein